MEYVVGHRRNTRLIDCIWEIHNKKYVNYKFGRSGGVISGFHLFAHRPLARSPPSSEEASLKRLFLNGWQGACGLRLFWAGRAILHLPASNWSV